MIAKMTLMKTFNSEAIPSYVFKNLMNPPRMKSNLCVQNFMSDFFDQSHDYQMVKTTELWEHREFERMLTTKSGNEHDQLEQVRRFILKMVSKSH